MSETADEQWMDRALALARKGEGGTRPNPPVGAVCVRAGRVVGEGYHRRAGGPHAEVYALRRAGGRARGATLYVTLEPCCTIGRTPPCTDAILAAGVRRVVVSVADPNPAHAGRGLRWLRAQDVEVASGVRAAEGGLLIEPFARWILEHRPFCTLKLGMTLDGKLADREGRARWITGVEARREVQALRRRVDAILVGSRTVCNDDPHLQPRPPRGRMPFRVVVSTSGRIPPTARLLNDEFVDRTLVATTRRCDARTHRRLEKNGVEVLVLPAAGRHVSLNALFRALARRGILHVLCEGGGQLAEELIRTGLVDEYRLYISPSILGGESVSAVQGRGWSLAGRPRLHFLDTRRVGADICVVARPIGRRR